MKLLFLQMNIDTQLQKKPKHALDDSVLAEVSLFAIKVGRICFLQYNLMLFPTILTYTALKNINLKNRPPLTELTCSIKYDATVSGQLFVDATSNQSTFLEYLHKTEIVQYH